MDDFKTDDVVKIDDVKDPVKIKEEDFGAVDNIRALADNLNKLRQEIGRHYQIISELASKASGNEIELRNKRIELAKEYGLDKHPGQWVVDFEKKEFVKLDDSSPVTP